MEVIFNFWVPSIDPVGEILQKSAKRMAAPSTRNVRSMKSTLWNRCSILKNQINTPEAQPSSEMNRRISLRVESATAGDRNESNSSEIRSPGPSIALQRIVSRNT